MFLLLPWLAAAYVWAQPQARPAGTTGAAEKIEEEFWRSADAVEPVLAEMKSVRLAFPQAADQGALVARMQALSDEYRRWMGTEEELRSEHHRHIQGLALMVLSHDIALVKAKKFAPNALGGHLYGRERAAEKMRSRVERLYSVYQNELEAFNPMRDAYQARRAAKRRNIALASIAALALAAAFLYDRAGRRESVLRASTAPPAPRLPQLVAGNFEVVGLLGRGSMGEVYEAVDTSLNRRAALKRLRPELLLDPAELEGLLKEARVMASLKHPNLVAIYSVEKDGDQVYLAMEFVAGASLERRLEAERRLPWAEALRILDGAGAAVDYAHGRKVIHRDLKPANIMLSEKSEVKVMDFGIAYQAAKSVSRLTRAPAWGTPAYMAPEQEMGGLSQAVDIFALSVCLYEMLTGELPFKGPNFLAQKRESLWAAPSGLVSGLPAGIDRVFSAALAPEPSRRFPSAGALAAACRSLQT